MKNFFLFTLLAILLVSSNNYSQLLLNENFDYGASDNPDITVVAPTWVRHSGAQGPQYSAAGLTYSGYVNSNVGGAVSFTNGSSGVNDGDVNRKLNDSISNNSTIYTSFLLELASAQATGDYFFHIGPATIGTIFRLRVFARTEATGYVLGLSKSSEVASYSSVVMNFNQTYLIVVKYEFNTAATNDDQVTLYAYSSGVPTSEPGTTLVTLGPTGNTVTGDPANIGSIAIRQGTNTPTGKVDGIRVATSWEQAPVPVELSSFSASVIGNSVNLTWVTASETNNQGFEVQRAVNGNWKSLGFVNGKGTTVDVSTYSYIDKNVTSGKTYNYRLKQVDFDGSYTFYNLNSEVVIGAPTEFSLDQNYPNPFNPETKINFAIPVSGNVKLSVYNLLGQEVATLVNGFKQAGSHTVNFEAKGLQSGMYFYKLETASFTQTRKMTLLK